MAAAAAVAAATSIAISAGVPQPAGTRARPDAILAAAVPRDGHPSAARGSRRKYTSNLPLLAIYGAIPTDCL